MSPTISGTPGDDFPDYADGTAGNDVIYLYSGNDWTLGNGGNDVVYGGTGNDIAYGDSGIFSGLQGGDTLFGEDGDDRLWGEGGNDRLYGGTGDDQHRGGLGNDTSYGGAGNDRLLGDEGNDTLWGDAGNDTLYGDAGNDTLSGDANDDTLYGGDGSDGLFGGDGNEVLQGGDGNDTLWGGYGNDTLWGGDGDDTLWDETGNGTLWGGGGNDRLWGGDGDNMLWGETGNDTLWGDVGNDRLWGGDGDNTLWGGADRDILYAGAGDVVDGGSTGDDLDTLDLTGLGPLRVIYGGGNNESGTVELLDANRNVTGTIAFAEIETVIPCFTPGAMIDTRRGPVAVEELREGDRVLTRDNGFRTIRWIGSRTLDAATLAAAPQLRPVCIRRDAFGPGMPARDMVVSPQHRMLLAGAGVELHAGETEVLVAARHLGLRTLRPLPALAEVTYLHLLFDGHEIVRADGAWTESFQPGRHVADAMEAAVREELLTIFPALGQSEGPAFAAARPTLRAWEARALHR